MEFDESEIRREKNNKLAPMSFCRNVKSHLKSENISQNSLNLQLKFECFVIQICFEVYK